MLFFGYICIMEKTVTMPLEEWKEMSALVEKIQESAIEINSFGDVLCLSNEEVAEKFKEMASELANVQEENNELRLEVHLYESVLKGVEQFFRKRPVVSILTGVKWINLFPSNWWVDK